MDLVSRIQRLPIGKFHYTLLLVIGLGWMFDAMDTGLISFILAKMAEDWAMTPTEKGWVVSIGFVGMADFQRFVELLDDNELRKIVMEAAYLDRDPENGEAEIVDCLKQIKRSRDYKRSWS